MVMLVSLQQASDHLRRDGNDDDADLTLKIKAASGAVLNYLKSGEDFLDSAGDVELDSAGDPLFVPEEVQAAVLILVGMFYDGSSREDWEPGYLPKAVTALLYPLRDPAMG